MEGRFGTHCAEADAGDIGGVETCPLRTPTRLYATLARTSGNGHT
jgi:hypothetical protein